MSNTVILCANGALGYVVSHQHARHQTCVYLAGQGTLVVPEDTRGRIVVKPEDLAYAYVEWPATRPMVTHPLGQARYVAAHALDDLPSPKPH